MPIYIKAQLRAKIYKIKGMYKNGAEGITDSGLSTMKEEIERMNEKTTEDWQKEWRSHNKENWTREIIDDAAIFAKKRKDIDYYTMMILTGHGIFNDYKIRIKKGSNNKCWECNEDPHDAEHALCKCPKWATQRVELKNKIGDTLTDKNFINEVLNSEDPWTNFKKLCHDIMKQR
jgi:hypothetical protein